MNGIQVELSSAFVHNSLATVRWTEVKAADHDMLNTRMVIKNWTFSSTASYPGTTNPWSMNLGTGDPMIPPPAAGFGDLTNVSGIPGQGSTTPDEKVFDFHFIVQADASLLTSTSGGPYFDPSYGVSYSSVSDFEAKAIGCDATGHCGGYAVPDDQGFHPGHYFARKSGATPNITLTPRLF